MPSYAEALDLITAEAHRAASQPNRIPATEPVPPFHAVNRISKHTYRSPISTPKFDTSAMDGYALNSDSTKTASPESPVIFCVKGIMAAGDEPAHLSGEPGAEAEIQVRDGTGGTVFPCVEIMTGARFPEAIGGSRAFDCCVKMEDVEPLSKVKGVQFGNSYIKVTQPAQFRQNRRLAGADFGRDDSIIGAGQVIQPRHIMALASVGLSEVEVVRKPTVALFSTGNELSAQKSGPHCIRDANGPYITAYMQSRGLNVDFIGVLNDGVDTIIRTLEPCVNGSYAAIVTTGAVSTGRFDLIPEALQRLQAGIVFHKVSIRPGHPALFAKITQTTKDSQRTFETAFFGLPGNPVASAACLRFLVEPYLRRIQNQKPETALKATMRQTHPEHTGGTNGNTNGIDTNGSLISRFPIEKDVFRPGVFSHTQNKLNVTLISDHSPGKIKPFLAANCWIHIPEGMSKLHAGDIVDIYINE